MGRQRKFPPPRFLVAVGDTPQEASDILDRLISIYEQMEAAPGRKVRVDRLGVAVAAFRALPPKPIGRRETRKHRESLKGCVGSGPVRAENGMPLAGFGADDDDPKRARSDEQAAIALQHALAERGDPVSLSDAVRIIHDARKRFP